MPTIKETTVYQFSELSEDAKRKALEKIYAINVDYDWWDCTYEDAKNIGIKITGFDLERGRHITGELTDNSENVARAIVNEHGENCDTYKTAQTFLNELVVKQVALKLLEDDEDFVSDTENEIEELSEEFEKDILNNYWKMLESEYDYLQSEEAIIETIESNEYEFEEDGSRF